MKNIKLKRNTILSSLLIITLCFLNILLCSDHKSSALTYSSNVDVGFTFNPTISVNLSGDLLINNLAPGSVSDSNTINVTVATNASQGYVLTATSGTKTTNTDLVNQTNSAYKFTSIATNASMSSLTTDNTWGFSYSSDSGSTWSNYSGLPLDNDDEGATGKQLLSTINPSDNRTIQFKIGAKAGPEQAAGTYTNVINFYAVANVSSGRNYTINYIDPSGNAINMPAQQTGTIENNEITISDEWPEDSEGAYEFSNWCDSYDGYSDYMEYCSSEDYYPGDTITVADGISDITIDLYAIWYPLYGDLFLEIDNQSNAEVVVNESLHIDAFSYDSLPVGLGDYNLISIAPPSTPTCQGTWSWNMDILDSDGNLHNNYSGSSSDSITLITDNAYIVVITDSCSN